MPLSHFLLVASLSTRTGACWLVSLCQYDDDQDECKHTDPHACRAVAKPPPPPIPLARTQSSQAKAHLAHSPDQELCRNTPNWKNKYGLGCDGYVKEGHCAGGNFVSGHSWAGGPSYGLPEMNCCDCGKRSH